MPGKSLNHLHSTESLAHSAQPGPSPSQSTFPASFQLQRQLLASHTVTKLVPHPPTVTPFILQQWELQEAGQRLPTWASFDGQLRSECLLPQAELWSSLPLKENTLLTGKYTTCSVSSRSGNLGYLRCVRGSGMLAGGRAALRTTCIPKTH